MTDDLPPIPTTPARVPPTPTSAVALGVDPTGVVAADCSCRQCGYNVRGLHISRHCPECGTPIAVSARGDALEFCEPRWVKKLATGAAFVYWGVTLLLLTLIGMVILLFTGFSFLAAGQRSDIGVVIITVSFVCFVLVGMLGGPLLAYVGSWFLTAREPLAFEPSDRSKARSIVRLGLVMAILSPVLEAITESTTLPRAMEILMIVVSAPMALFALYAIHQYYRWIAQLAERLHDASLQSRCNMLGKWVPIGLFPPTVIAIMQSIMEAVSRARGPASSSAPAEVFDALVGLFSCATCLSSLLLLVLMFVALGVQRTLRLALRAVAAHARNNWDSATYGRRGVVH